MFHTEHCPVNSTKARKRTDMKNTLCRIIAVCLLALPLASFAQSTDNMKQDQPQQQDQMKHDDMKKDDGMKHDDMKKDDGMKQN
jgi:pentapeptide MXKDX repeat protein